MDIDEATVAARKLKWAKYLAVGYTEFAAFEKKPVAVADGKTSFAWGAGRSTLLGKTGTKMTPHVISLRAKLVAARRKTAA